MKCKICGKETAKGRQVCIGCNCTKEVFRKGSKSSKTQQEIATKHMLSTDKNLSLISWKSFFK